MNLKNITKIFILAGLLVTGNSCEVLDVAPANRIPEEDASGDPTRVLAVVNGVYEAAQQGFYNGAVQRGYPFGAASTEQGDMKGEDMYNDQLFYEVTYINAWNSSTANNNGMWISLYRLINRINITLDVIAAAEAKGVITAAVANTYRGEMYFLRALSHHEVVIHFSRPYSDNPNAMGVPYHTTAYNDVGKVAAGLEVGRGTVAETYTKILADLDLSETLTGGANRPYRATSGAAIALKTRVKLHMEDWAGVLTEYTKLTTTTYGTFALQASPETPFTSWTTNESIFSLTHSSASNPGVNGALVNMYGAPALGGRGLVKVSPVIWKQTFWDAADRRRTLLTTGTTYSTGVFTTKYRRFGTNDDPTPLIRFAEVVLNAAEARARTNDLPGAITLLNTIRDRSKPAATASYDLAALGGTQDGVLDGIFNERRIEFLGEGRRWSDIHRLSGEGKLTGIPLKAQSRSVTAIAQYSSASVTMDHSLLYTDDRFIWPIPIEETLYNPTLASQQNPGY
jgi:starch-binding outer membrane protein, SusD/RagB family